MNTTVDEHKQGAPTSVPCAVITISDSRTWETDHGGRLLAELLLSGGHTVESRQIVADEPGQISAAIAQVTRERQVQAILLTGGTGITPRDQTFETISAMIEKPIPGYGELFRMLSYQDIGPSAMLSRAVAGIADGVLLLTMPGSPAAVRLALEKLVLPELAHLVSQASKK